MRMTRLAVLTLGVATLSACSGAVQDRSALTALCEVGKLGQAINSTGPVPEGCVKINGGDLAEKPTLTLDGATVTITDVRLKDDSGGEFIGFTFTSTGAPVSFAVKAGGETYAGTSSPWVHPKGTTGPEASAISNVTFCPAGAGGDDSGGGTPGGDDTGGNPGGIPGSDDPGEPVGGQCPGAGEDGTGGDGTGGDTGAGGTPDGGIGGDDGANGDETEGDGSGGDGTDGDPGTGGTPDGGTDPFIG